LTYLYVLHTLDRWQNSAGAFVAKKNLETGEVHMTPEDGN